MVPAFALASEEAMRSSLEGVVETSPLHHTETSGGHRMFVAITNCGDLGWISDRSGYRYARTDPQAGRGILQRT